MARGRPLSRSRCHRDQGCKQPRRGSPLALRARSGWRLGVARWPDLPDALWIDHSVWATRDRVHADADSRLRLAVRIEQLHRRRHRLPPDMLPLGGSITVPVPPCFERRLEEGLTRGDDVPHRGGVAGLEHRQQGRSRLQVGHLEPLDQPREATEGLLLAGKAQQATRA